jgi:ADP-ribose pyrophosphatase YjhB (NUDIX family)
MADQESQYTANIITRLGDEGREFLVIEYDSGDGAQIKFPGGTSNDHPGETVLETLHRETRDETGLVLPVEPVEVYKKSFPDRESGKGGTHTKYAYTIEFDQCAGTLRTQSMVDGGDRLSPPFWRTAQELLVKVESGGLFWTHRPMLQSAIEHYRAK